MKKILLILAAIAVILPVSAFANHLDGNWGSYGSNYLSFSVGNQNHRFSHNGNVPFVDEHGATVDYNTLRPNQPVRVHYSGRRGHEVVNRVVVHKRTTDRHYNR